MKEKILKKIHRKLLETERAIREDLAKLRVRNEQLKQAHEILASELEKQGRQLAEYEQSLSNRMLSDLRRRISLLEESTRRELNQARAQIQRSEQRCRFLEAELAKALEKLKETQKVREELGDQLSLVKQELLDLQSEYESKIGELTRKLERYRVMLSRYRELTRERESELRMYERGLAMLEDMMRRELA